MLIRSRNFLNEKQKFQKKNFCRISKRIVERTSVDFWYDNFFEKIVTSPETGYRSFWTWNLTVFPDWLLNSGLMDGPIAKFLLYNSLFS